jgi:hypothetical protein
MMNARVGKRDFVFCILYGRRKTHGGRPSKKMRMENPRRVSRILGGRDFEMKSCYLQRSETLEKVLDTGCHFAYMQ